ncbi:MAG TPA: SDR family NAD(P)-dependent oxidoreductase [Thermoleophilaceae bacterium]|nr:SDR family NAD(P)-dependent oxidoreductase [Thermoleophilaceae bacterium]
MEIGAGTRVLVTGAGRGIGRAAASAFAGRGCVLGLVARSAEELEAVAAGLPGEGHEAIPADVSDRDVVANAGAADYHPFQGMDLDMELSTTLHDHEKPTMPGWYDPRNSRDAEPIGAVVVRAVERDERDVHFPPNVAALRTAPRLADFLIRRARGAAAAPRRG